MEKDSMLVVLLLVAAKRQDMTAGDISFIEVAVIEICSARCHQTHRDFTCERGATVLNPTIPARGLIVFWILCM